MDINIQGVSITLTEDQLKKISKELNNKTKTYNSFEDIDNLEDAINYLNRVSDYSMNCIDRIPAINKIEIINKAINSLDKSQVNNYWYPLFNVTNNSLVGFSGSRYTCSSSTAGVAYFKSQKASDHMGKIALDLYREFHNERKRLI